MADKIATASTMNTYLTDYSSAYDIYKDCSMNDSVMDCSSAQIQYNAAASRLNTYYPTISTSNQTSDQYQSVVDTHQSVITMREKLRVDLDELHHNMKESDAQNTLDTNIYAGICWTILATSTLYIILVEL